MFVDSHCHLNFPELIDQLPQIRQAVEALFEVKVLEVRTITVRPKPKRRGHTSGKTRAWKKAIVQVRPGDTIPVFQGLQGMEG